MSSLYRGPHFTLDYQRASRYVRLVRSAEPLASAQEAAAALKLCGRALRGIDLVHLGILLDWRLAPLSTDPALHSAVVTNTDAFAAHFARKALLLATPVGQMQVGRISRVMSTVKPVVFNDEAAAIDYVTSR